MKKLLLSLVLIVTATGSVNAADGKLRVRMACKTVGDTIVAILFNDMMNRQTFVGKQGVFDFEISVPQPQVLYLLEPAAVRGERNARYYQIPAMPGEEVLITATEPSRYDVMGSKFYNQYHEADLAIEAVGKGGNSDQAIMDFIKAHPDYEASAAIVIQLSSLEKMEEAVELLSPAVREGRAKDFYEGIIARVKAKKKEEEASAKKQAEGIAAPDFTLNDLNGKPLSLSSLRGKYVILDFWGAWCSWCIKGIPEMKKYYEKYSGKFEILGIDCNDTDQKWRDAVKKYELPWLHVYNPRDSKVLSDYGIQGFPTKIIVGPDGKIVKTVVGEDPSFYALLDSLFGAK